MGLGRRKARLGDPQAWVFNRMADVYEARPAYPRALVDALCSLAERPAARMLDVGAGVGHLALPLARRGLSVVAIEPAARMLDRLRAAALREALLIETHHATAESIPLESASCDWAIVADALHFLDAELSGKEIGRVLARTGGLCLITCELADTPFMRAVVEIMHEAAPRRPRAVAGHAVQLSRLAGLERFDTEVFEDECAVSAEALDDILRSISFVGPAMNPQRFARFRERIHAVSEPRAWARRFTLRWGTKA